LKRLELTFVVMGFNCSIIQVLLAREFMTIFSGNELVLGVLFVNWLLCIALGSWGLGKLADRQMVSFVWLVFILIGISVILPAQIVFLRSIVSRIVAERGEMAGLISTFYSTFIVLLPFCSLYGFQFSLGCKLYARGGVAEYSSIQIGRVYVLEALGSVIGGLVFTYILASNLRALEISIGLSLLNLFLAMILLLNKNVVSSSNEFLKAVIAFMVMVGGFAFFSGWIGNLDASSYHWQWRGLGLIHSENSVYGNIAVTQSGDQVNLWVNGLPIFTSPNPDVIFVEEVVHFPMLQHPMPERVLLIGGGLGGVLEELLKHPVSKVTYIELDPALIKLTKIFSPESAEVLKDPRVEAINLDGRLFVKKANAVFDVVIINLPPPSTLQLNRFYTIEFFKEIRSVLDEDGILSFGLSSSLAHMSKEMAARNRCVYETLIEVFPCCLIVPGDFNLFLASSSCGDEGATWDVEVLTGRLRNRGLATSVFTDDYIRYKLSPERMAIGLAYLHGEGMDVNMDMRPIAVFHDLALWNVMLHPGSGALFSLLSEVKLWWLAPPLMLLFTAMLMIQRRWRSSRLSVYVAVLTTGIAGMTSSIVILYAFQALCGYLYIELGVLTASFMFGAALGGWFMAYMISEQERDIKTLCKTEIMVIAYSILMPIAIMGLSESGEKTNIISIARCLFPLMNGIAGFIVGMEFPLASQISMRVGGRVGSVAGALYATDLMGACIGSLIASIWLVPLHGVIGVCLVAAILNVASLIALYLSSIP